VGEWFSVPSRLAPGPIQPPVEWVTGLSWGKANTARCWQPILFQCQFTNSYTLASHSVPA
jgi:hypothetical protein